MQVSTNYPIDSKARLAGARWCRFAVDSAVAFGRIAGSDVQEFDGAPWYGASATGISHPLARVKLLPPVLPQTFYAAGLNYREHIVSAALRQGREPRFPDRPEVGLRSSSALCADGDPIIKPRDAGELFQYEGELVAVIGKGGRRISRDKALDHVFGWTIGNDVSERLWQRSDRTNWRAKNTDSFKPMGPWIVQNLDYRTSTTMVRINGEEVERFSTGDMINDVEAYIAEVSAYSTLHPGDVIWMGTDGSPRNLRPGDVCEVEITGIGILRNPVVGEP